MKKIKLSFEISGIVYIEKETEEDPLKITIKNYGKTINEMREFYAKLREKEKSENIPNQSDSPIQTD